MASPTRERKRSMKSVLCLLGVLGSTAALMADAREPLFFDGAAILAGDPAAPRSIDRGGLLVRGGIIAAVGTPAELGEPPPGARRIDAAGLFAVPAFIDAYTQAGLAAPAPPSRNEDLAPDLRDGPPAITRPARRAGLTPEWNVLDGVAPDSADFERHRRAGFAAAHVAPAAGYLAGQTAVLSLAGEALRDAVVRERCAIAGGFSAPQAAYPRSLMGAFAHLRQSVVDAGRCLSWQKLYLEDPSGLPRPPRDTALEAIVELRAERRPLVVPADAASAIERALLLAGELSLPPIVAGGREAARVLAALKTARAAVVLLPQYPEKPKIEDRPGALPHRVQEERVERWREEAGTLAALDRAGIPAALGTGSARDPEALVRSVQRAIGQGVAPAQALRALTLGAAEILGVARTHGSIDKGKAACVAFFDRRFGEEGARLRFLVIDGKLFEYELPPREPPKEAPKAEPKAEPKDEKKDEKKDAPPPSEPRGPDVDCELETDRKPSLRTGGDLFIRDATVFTLARGTLPRASIRIRGGRIEAVGPDVDAGGIAAAIDGAGLFVIPGIIDCHSHLAVDGGVNETSESVTCEVRIRDALDPRDVGIYRALAGGATAAHVLHGSANTIGGLCQLVKLKYGRPREEMVVDWAPPTVKFALGENVRQSNSPRRGQRFPTTRMGVEATLRRAFAAARDYEAEWKDHAAGLARGERALEPRRDLRLEALLKVLRGEILVHAHCYRADEILMLLRVAEDFGFRIATLQHVLEGYRVAPEIARHGAAASTFSDWWAYKLESFDAIPHNAALMARAGVLVSLNSDSDELIRRLNHEAAKAARYGGAAEDEALKMVTLNPAKQLRAEHRLGSIEAGKDADLAIFDAHPLSIYARCLYTIIEGEVYFERKAPRGNPQAGRPLPASRDFLPAEPPRHPGGLYAIRDARVVPVASAPIDRGTVVIAAGRIAAVGPSAEVAVPAGAAVIDGQGLSVYPGLIDAGSTLGLVEIESVAGSVDLDETGSAQPDLRVAVAVNAHSELIPSTRASGITAAAVFGRGGLIGGQAGVIRLAGTSTPEATLRDRFALQVNLPRVGRDDKDDPPAVKELKDWFARARRYASAANGRDQRLEALLPFAKKELPVVFAADSEAQLRLAIRLAADLDVRAVVRGARDAWKVASLLKEKGIAAIVGPVLALPIEAFDPYDAPYRNASRLHEAGVPFAFQSGDDASFSRNLPFNAGTAVAFGLPHDAAVRALTLGAAEILGIAERRGSIAAGKAADLIVVDGDPLETLTLVHYVFIDGQPQSLETRQTRFYRQFRDRLTARGRGNERGF